MSTSADEGATVSTSAAPFFVRRLNVALGTCCVAPSSPAPTSSSISSSIPANKSWEVACTSGACAVPTSDMMLAQLGIVSSDSKFKIYHVVDDRAFLPTYI